MSHSQEPTPLSRALPPLSRGEFRRNLIADIGKAFSEALHLRPCDEAHATIWDLEDVRCSRRLGRGDFLPVHLDSLTVVKAYRAHGLDKPLPAAFRLPTTAIHLRSLLGRGLVLCAFTYRGIGVDELHVRALMELHGSRTLRTERSGRALEEGLRVAYVRRIQFSDEPEDPWTRLSTTPAMRVTSSPV